MRVVTPLRMREGARPSFGSRRGSLTSMASCRSRAASTMVRERATWKSRPWLAERAATWQSRPSASCMSTAPRPGCRKANSRSSRPQSMRSREVAIKVLPEAFARDPDRLRRFEREARPQAREPVPLPGRPGEDPRFRSGEGGRPPGPGERDPHGAHRGRPGGGHPGLHEPGAGARGGPRRPQRPLQPGRGDVGDALRSESLPAGQHHRDPPRHPEGGAPGSGSQPPQRISRP